MHNQLYNNILSVTTPPVVDAINAYFDHRIDFYNNKLQSAETMDEVRKYQGAIFELKHLKKIRDHAVSVVKKDK